MGNQEGVRSNGPKGPRDLTDEQLQACVAKFITQIDTHEKCAALCRAGLALARAEIQRREREKL